MRESTMKLTAITRQRWETIRVRERVRGVLIKIPTWHRQVSYQHGPKARAEMSRNKFSLFIFTRAPRSGDTSWRMSRLMSPLVNSQRLSDFGRFTITKRESAKPSPFCQLTSRESSLEFYLRKKQRGLAHIDSKHFPHFDRQFGELARAKRKHKES